MSSLIDLSVSELAAAIASGQTSAADATSAYLAAIEAREAGLAAFNEILADNATEQARAIDNQLAQGRCPGPLAGVPLAVKDNLCTTQGHTTCSSKLLADFRAPYTATAVEKLQSSGAVILGKTNLDEFAMGSSTENSGSHPTKNPWDLSRVPGGSSGGSAAAVAARQCAAALGSDTGGSIRQPAAFCGVVGLKPTYGRVSRYGLVAYGSSLDQIGPLARDVTDAAMLLQAIAGHDPRDSTSIPQPVDDYLSQLDTPPQGLRIGLPTEFYSEALDPEINSALHTAAEAYRTAGAEIVEVSLPTSRIDRAEDGSLSSFAVACYYIVAMAEASGNLARYDGVHYGHRTARHCEDIIELYSRSRAEGFGPEVQRRIMLGTYALSSGYYDAYYLKALKVRRLIRNDFDAALKTCDVLLCPATPTAAFALGEKTGDPLTMYLADIYTVSVNLAGLPALTIPAGLTDAGLPVGMQLIGPVFSEPLLLQTARLFERTTGISRLVPPLVANKGPQK